MGKKFNLKSGNCPSFKEMGSGDSPFNQGFGDFLRKGVNTTPIGMMFNAATGNKDAPNFFKDIQERINKHMEEKKAKENKEREDALSSSLERSMRSVHKGHSKSTEKMNETNENLPESRNNKEEHSH